MAAVEKAIVAHDDYERTECEGNNSKVDEGVLVGLMKHVLGTHGISVQRYWNGALVGPDCRRLLENHDVILGDIRKGMLAARYGGTDARDFVDRHTAVLKELVVVSSITRRVNRAGAGGLLSDAERAELKRACAAFGAAWRESYRRILTPKAHIVEVHVPLCRPLPRVRCLRRGRRGGAARGGQPVPAPRASDPQPRGSSQGAHAAPHGARLYAEATKGGSLAAVGEAEGGEGGGEGGGGSSSCCGSHRCSAR